MNFVNAPCCKTVTLTPYFLPNSHTLIVILSFKPAITTCFITPRRKTPFTSLNLSAFGRNLGILYSAVPFIDPQVITGAGNAQGLENAQVPATSSFGFNISAKF